MSDPVSPVFPMFYEMGMGIDLVGEDIGGQSAIIALGPDEAGDLVQRHGDLVVRS